MPFFLSTAVIHVHLIRLSFLMKQIQWLKMLRSVWWFLFSACTSIYHAYVNGGLIFALKECLAAHNGNILKSYEILLHLQLHQQVKSGSLVYVLLLSIMFSWNKNIFLSFKLGGGSMSSWSNSDIRFGRMSAILIPLIFVSVHKCAITKSWTPITARQM